jgi:hypothetical protein
MSIELERMWKEDTWPNLSICLQGLRRTMINAIQNSQYPVGDLNWLPPENKSEPLPLEPTFIWKSNYIVYIWLRS